MKIEMFEKVGEINVIALRSAAENKSIAEVERARKAEEERIRKEAEERENARIANDVLMKLVNAINAEAEKGGEHLRIEWKESDTMEPFGIGWYDYGRAIKHILPILEAAGYRVDERHVYSDSWTRRSGKWGYAYIWWHEQ
jgi:hypothetical protein